jgi:hypothetical protein
MRDDAVRKLDRLIDGLHALVGRAGDDDVILLTEEDAALVNEACTELLRRHRQRLCGTDRLS